MSELKVNKISPRSGTDVTLGDSGDTFTVPAGASIVNNGTATGFGATGAVNWDTTAKTANFNAVSKVGYFVDTTLGAITVTLPATPSAGDIVGLVDYAGTFDTNALTIDPNGEDLEGGTDNLALTGEREGVVLVYVDSTQGWLPISGINEGTDALGPVPYSIDFLVVAGGGGGGHQDSGGPNNATGGGGGAGGYRTSTQTANVGTVITVTVGNGGAGGASAGNNGTTGSNSSISGSGLTTITSAGGGGGGRDTANGLSGGSGGGGGGETGPATGGSGNTPSTAPSQGNNGGNGGATGPGYGAGGGGGAGAVGTNGTTGGPGNGGNGTASSITGSSITRAGGGGGARYNNNTSAPNNNGTGGSGGGGNGSTSTVAAVSGTVNTGGGGGGGGGPGPASPIGAAGGKGVVILSMPLANFSNTTTGSPTESDDGTTKVLVFNGDGSYTA
jgi:hypothetical protein